MSNDYIIRLGLDQGNVPQASAAAAKSISNIGAAGQISARQTAAAMRTLPAQFTDVATQLAGGQNPLLVLLQQGGQIKDSFGGVGNAVRAVAASLNPLTVGLTAGAGALAAIGVGYVQGAREAQAYNEALVLSGNAIGLTNDALADMAARLDVAGSTQSAAAASLAELAGNALVSAQNIEAVAEVALRMERVTGKAASETVKQFQELGKSPLEASIKLNEAVNFLTRSVYDQIRALVEQGRTAEAAAVAQQAYLGVLNNRLPVLEGNLGSLQRAWRGVGQFASEAWDAMLGIGREATGTERIKQVEAQIAALDNRKSTNPALTAARREVLTEQLAALREVDAMARRSAATQATETAGVRDYIKAQEELARLRAKGRATGRGEFVGPQTFDEMFPAANVAEIQRYQRDNDSALRQFLVSEKAAYTARDEAMKESRIRVEKQITDELALEQERRTDDLTASIADGILGGFRDGRSFADVFLMELKAQFAKTVLSPLIRPTVEAGNDLISQLLRGAASIIGGGLSIDTGGYGITPADGSIPLPTRGGMATGTNYVPRDMLALVHKGEAIVPARYNPAGGGGGASQITYAPSFSIDSRTDQAQIATLVANATAEGQRQMLELLKERGVV
jgi:phage-related minor tail protein